MREYINRLSRGKFRYDIPDIIQPDDVIIEDVICDTIHNAEFHIQAQDVIKGVVYSDNAKVTVLTPSFAGKDSDIKYVIDARGLSEGDSIEGEFTLVTNAGEKEVLYSFTAVKETVDTSLGKADNLFHFTNLVQVNKEEAVSLYRSDKFKKIFLQGDDVLNNLYDVRWYSYRTICSSEYIYPERYTHIKLLEPAGLPSLFTSTGVSSAWIT